MHAVRLVRQVVDGELEVEPIDVHDRAEVDFLVALQDDLVPGIAEPVVDRRERPVDGHVRLPDEEVVDRRYPKLPARLPLHLVAVVVQPHDHRLAVGGGGDGVDLLHRLGERLPLARRRMADVERELAELET